MTILIDKPLWWHRGERWSHLVSDQSYEELHRFAAQLGIPRRAFQGDHYDVPERHWQSCVDLGAVPTDSRTLVKRLRAAGLRRAPVGSRTRPILTRYQPMKAVPGRLPQDDGWAYEIKWDGMRAIVTNDASGVRAHSSRMNDITPRFPELAGLHDVIGASDIVLDGELVAFAKDGLPSFSRLQSRMHLTRSHDIERRRLEVPAVFVVFDLLRFDRTEAIGLPFDDRRQLLSSVLEPGPTWQLSTLHLHDGASLLDAVRERGMEGIVAKRRSSTYQPGTRSSDWIKVKPRRRQEFVVGGWVGGEGSRRDNVSALIVGYHGTSGFRSAGRVGSGLSDTRERALRPRLDALARPSSPFVDPIEPVPGRRTHFVDPELVVEVAFGEWTSDGNLRHPVYLGWRDDVDPTTVTREEPDAAPSGGDPASEPAS